MVYTLPKLDYSYDALLPYIDETTMMIHQTKHHQAYIDNLNKALADYPDLADKPLEELLSDLDKVPEVIRMAVRNHGGGHFNHSLFWKVIGPASLKENAPTGEFLKAMENDLGGVDKFKEDFAKAAMGRFGSGWAWLVLDKEKLSIMSTANQDTPLAEGKIPLLGLDVWEHAYYLKYQNRRADYVTAFWNVVNWAEVSRNFTVAV